ncbi:MAG: hypothetical protein NDF54_11560 [archaeon GB-1867-035]|nr:hypothetical protein [Candidatus Culexmicrobium profundum]
MIKYVLEKENMKYELIWKRASSIDYSIEKKKERIIQERSRIISSANKLYDEIENIIKHLIKEYKLIPDEIESKKDFPIYKYHIRFNENREQYELSPPSRISIER